MVIRVVKNLLAYILSVHPSLTRVQNLLNQARDFWSYTPTLNSSYNLHRTLKVIFKRLRTSNMNIHLSIHLFILRVSIWCRHVQ